MFTPSIAGVGQSAIQLLQQLSRQQSGNTLAGGTSTQAAQGGHHRRHHGVSGAESQAQVSSLLDAITAALQSSDASSDPNKIIEDTVAKLLQNDGSATGGEGTTAATVKSAACQASDQQGLLQVLQQHGVDLQQFRADLLAAVKNAQNGQVNASTALQSFPPGSNLNLVA